MIVRTAAGALLGLGVFLAATGWRGEQRPPASAPAGSSRSGKLAGRLGGLPLGAAGALPALGTGLVVFLLTAWPVGAALCALAVVAVPRVFAGPARAKGAVARADAVAAWAEMLRDTMAGASGIEEAIVATADVAPEAIRDPVILLAARLERDRLGPALSAFADEVADPAADLVVTALLLASDHHARDLGAVLSALATSARAEAAMVLRVEAGRARLRTAARVVVVTTLGFAALLVGLNRDFLAPYDDALGQAWLLVVGGAFALGLRELDRLARFAAPPRLLARAPSGEGA